MHALHAMLQHDLHVELCWTKLLNTHVIITQSQTLVT